MDRDSVALGHLVDAALSIHDRNRQEASDGPDEFVDISDDEIRQIVRALWAGRNTGSRKEFQDAVGQAVVRWVKE